MKTVLAAPWHLDRKTEVFATLDRLHATMGFTHVGLVGYGPFSSLVLKWCRRNGLLMTQAMPDNRKAKAAIPDAIFRLVRAVQPAVAIRFPDDGGYGRYLGAMVRRFGGTVHVLASLTSPPVPEGLTDADRQVPLPAG